jgi:predicted ferric reductase
MAARPRIGLRRAAKTIVTWTVRSVALAVLTAIFWFWVRDGGITGIHDLGTLLTSVGRITGLLASYSLLIQVLLLARLPFLELIAGFDRLAVWHKINGKLCLYLILAHVAFITAGYALTDRLSISTEFYTILTTYPGMIAASIGTILLILVVVTSIVIVRRRLRYETWFLVHLMAYAGIFLTWFHQIPTGNEFITNPLAAAFWTALYIATLQLVLLFRVAQPIIRALWHGMRVAEVIEEAPGIVSLRITGRHLGWLNARAGQFFHWRFLDPMRWRESHPFSLSAAPDGTSLRITVKGLGDFSSRIGEIKPGTRVIAEGPFGSFTDDARSRHRVALIAGGVGITPIRALLEEMSGDLVLIYRVARKEDLIFREELERLASERGITIHYVVGDHRDPQHAHLMSGAHIRKLLPDIADREIYLCGPPAMMRSLERSVRQAGARPELIHIDQFAF